MTTIVPGLVKIGKTGENNFEQRMYNLEHNGYNQVVGLKRKLPFWWKITTQKSS